MNTKEVISKVFSKGLEGTVKLKTISERNKARQSMERVNQITNNDLVNTDVVFGVCVSLLFHFPEKFLAELENSKQAKPDLAPIIEQQINYLKSEFEENNYDVDAEVKKAVRLLLSMLEINRLKNNPDTRILGEAAEKVAKMEIKTLDSSNNIITLQSYLKSLKNAFKEQLK